MCGPSGHVVSLDSSISCQLTIQSYPTDFNTNQDQSNSLPHSSVLKVCSSVMYRPVGLHVNKHLKWTSCLESSRPPSIWCLPIGWFKKGN